MRSNWLRTVGLIGAVALGLLAVLPASAGGSGGAEGVPAFGNVFLIIGENTTYSQLNKNSAPYMTGTLLGKEQSAWLTNYFALTHYSEANYIGMTSGQFTSCEQKDGSVAACSQGVDNLFSQLDSAGISWTSWMESMPAPCYPSSSGGDATLNKYAPKHNPALFYTRISSAECQTSDIPAGTTGPNDMSAFDAALVSGDVARFNLVVPNECEDAHDNCMPPGNPITQFDNFVAREVPMIESSQAFGTNGVIIVTFDEAQTSSPIRALDVGNGGNVAFAVISPLAHNAQYSTVGYNHYSLLRTLEDGFGITTYLAGAGTAKPIADIWG